MEHLLLAVCLLATVEEAESKWSALTCTGVTFIFHLVSDYPFLLHLCEEASEG